jgi:adenylate cyclase class 2
LDRGVLDRRELEVTVSDVDAAQQILEALGYIQGAVYDKYRTVYRAGPCHVMLDELPIGDFVEIEGPDTDSIHLLAAELGLSIDSAVPLSYLALFERFCSGRPLDPNRLTFEALDGLRVRQWDLGVKYADE